MRLLIYLFVQTKNLERKLNSIVQIRFDKMKDILT